MVRGGLPAAAAALQRVAGQIARGRPGAEPGPAGRTDAITTALQGTPHEDLRTLLGERIFRPIGIEDPEWEIGYHATYTVDGLPLVPNWAGASFSTRATARLARLLLHRGDWQGRRILDADWLGRCITYAGTPLPDRARPYPWPAPTPGWWSNLEGVLAPLPRDACCGAGSGHQILLVIPSLDMTVVRYGGHLGDSQEADDFWADLGKHLFDPLMAALG